ncbi:MAG: ROK family protein [Anaerolineales bacterium]|nr:ROK family protein [Anaerolineales bacterium]
MTLSPLLLALDFGGTKLAAALTHPGEQTWLAHRHFSLPTGVDGRYEYDTMLDLAHDLIEECGRQPVAVGVSFGGPVYARQGLVRRSFHTPGWENTPLAEWLAAELNAPVAVDNDANAAALGEFRFGAGQDCQHLLYVTISTGIGGGWIINGQPYAGADGMAGEIGHLTVQPGGFLCPCGRQGCLEAEASGPAMAYRARLYLGKKKDKSDPKRDQGKRLLQLAEGKPEKITAQLIAQAATEGDKLSQQIIRESAERLGLGLAGALALMNPDRVILGGGVIKSGELWWQTVRDTARAHTHAETSIEIVPAALGDDAPLWGAAALAKEMMR